ncbi:tetratricopeptide repeat protein (plasmid) [Pseudorhodobacter turbinis]|uniref:Tetratricopeptide repeat protein n=1 Tax=Pseudorhodobacter turbinis TaxID=2500533 RepID=A0A4P8EKR2_9RHOB|nr:tetratricopeptide repeat protein [Pseudorhodobacter turbinis]QCO57657.1 tetratricopeptide repeat protein [Pseudorhodobacter turbinis]
MKPRAPFHNRIVATVFLIFSGLSGLPAMADGLDSLFDDLQTAEPQAAERVERKIWREWSKSGSAAMDLLLKRGRDALDEGETQAAIEHFTALIDHAPDFAEAWNGRATAYFQAGLYGPSVADIAQALRLNPRHFGAMSGFARILEDTGEPDRALQVYRSALAIHPHLSGVSEAVTRLETLAAGQEL